MDAVSRLCAWYDRHCVNDWHEDYGVKIGTLDNPGWFMKIDLKGTTLQEKPFQELSIERSDGDWIFAKRGADLFEAFGGPKNLNEMIESFLTWAD